MRANKNGKYEMAMSFDVCVLIFFISHRTSLYSLICKSYILTEYERMQSNALNRTKETRKIAYTLETCEMDFIRNSYCFKMRAIAIFHIYVFLMCAAPGWRLWLMQVYHAVLGVAYKLLSFIIVAICFNAIAFFISSFLLWRWIFFMFLFFSSFFVLLFGWCEDSVASLDVSFAWENRARSTCVFLLTFCASTFRLKMVAFLSLPHFSLLNTRICIRSISLYFYDHFSLTSTIPSTNY